MSWNPFEVIWREINSHGGRLNHLEHCEIPSLNEKFNNPSWGVWRRVDNLESENQSLRARIDNLEHEKANLIVTAERLQQRVTSLENLASNLEKYLFDAVNQHLGNVK